MIVGIEVLGSAQFVGRLWLLELVISEQIGLFTTFFLGLLIGCVMLFQSNIELSVKNRRLEERNVRLEVDFFRAQVNPHFLSNILNAFYNYSVRVSDGISEKIPALGDLNKYCYIETKDDLLPIKKELSVLEQYLELQRIRFGEQIQLESDLKVTFSGWEIPPLLIITLIENAFKPGSFSNSHAFVKITVNAAPGHLFVQVENSTTRSESHPKFGVGLASTYK